MRKSENPFVQEFKYQIFTGIVATPILANDWFLGVTDRQAPFPASP